MNSPQPYIRLRRKIKFEPKPTEWPHQRGGWSFVIDQLRSQLYAPDGILCISALEENISQEEPITEPWIGFVHQVPRSNYPWYPDLERMLMDESFKKSLEKCHGLFVISTRIKNYLVERVPVPVAKVIYPITPFPDELKFSREKFEFESTRRVLFIGEFMRNFQSFFDLKAPDRYEKILLRSSDVDLSNLYNNKRDKVPLMTNDSVCVREWVSNEEYDHLLSSSIVFLNLFDAGANTTVIECLARHTPLVINRLPGVEEYLGNEYPLYYDTLDEASELLDNDNKLMEASRYMSWYLEHNPLTGERFIQEFAGSAIFRSLPLPPSQKADSTQTKFSQFDLTVVVCSYKRVYNMSRLLERFCSQDYNGTFELILWNNNRETQSEITEICAPFQSRLKLRIIQSTENYYCIVRLAVSHLMQSELLLVCDDDVLPNANFISRFVAKWKDYGPRAVVGCRGHVFRQHSLHVDQPHLFWEDYCNMKFFDQEKPDRQVSHFSQISLSLGTQILHRGFNPPNPTEVRYLPEV